MTEALGLEVPHNLLLLADEVDRRGIFLLQCNLALNGPSRRGSLLGLEETCIHRVQSVDLVKVFGCRPREIGGVSAEDLQVKETAGEGLERYGLRYGDLSAAGEAVACARGDGGGR